MNAYELADNLDKASEYLTMIGNADFKQCANMLRQQADRIAELSKNVDELEEELLKATHPNAEPVAWMSPDSKFSKTEGKLFYIPLYTTPQKYCPTENNAAYEKGVIDGMAKQRQSRVDGIIGQIGDSPIHDLVHRTTPQIKELSDEEILNLYKETEADNGGIREFAKAILKKASEK